MPKVADTSDHERALGKLGDAIRARRQALKMSQEALADAAGINRTHMGEVERGKRNISFMSVVKIAKAMDARASDLIAEAGL
ncbi:MAG: helix-turn-helix transcriptional regulator [Phenylobacterium sp.]|uniref:helix-turn-helix domain-containing protein n=1 Tax=Phenylobacterium sp. TaxID=1871053 RepID=UPI0025EB23A4|nr:helix-turn-helix transcriptional regulator [Phenylobacterium sp.]MCA3739012.1 helix-turn-helix transcriptional regulator [Phenylobacterium sp.]